MDLYLLVALALILALATVWVRTATVKSTYRYVQNEKTLRKLKRETQQEKVRWLKLTTPEQLKGLAKTLGLHPPKIEQLLKYDSKSQRASR